MKKHENKNLPFQEKIVCCIVPDDEKDVGKIVDLIAVAFKAIYGIVILLFGKENLIVVTGENVPRKTISKAKEIIFQEQITDYVDIVPFPKGLENELINENISNQ